MIARLLVLLAVLGLALAPFMPAQRIYVCSMDGSVHATCCCHDDAPAAGMVSDGAGCCRVITILQFLSPGTDHVSSLPSHAATVPIDLLQPTLVALITWLEPLPAPRSTWPLLRPPDPLFVRYCAWLT